MANYKDIKYDYPASAITSGTFADARLSESSVTQHVTAFDDNKIVNDLSTLALRQASDENKSAYNTGSSSVDVFQDATGIDTTTNVVRNASEYVSSVSLVDNAVAPDNVYFYIGQATQISQTVISGSNDGSNFTTLHTDNSFSYPDSSQFTSTINWTNSTAYRYLRLVWQSSGDFPILHRIIYRDGSSEIDVENGATATTTSNFWPSSASGNRDINNAIDGSTSTFFHYNNENNLNITIDMGQIYSANATGNFTGTTITADSSVSSMGAIITYQDQAGTNALNTDIVLQLSADGGSNYSTATLTALPDFSTGIKMAKVNDLAVTAGTQLKYKISFANQASGSKEARIRGVSLQY